MFHYHTVYLQGVVGCCASMYCTWKGKVCSRFPLRIKSLTGLLCHCEKGVQSAGGMTPLKSWCCFPANAQTIATEALLLDAATSKKQRPNDVLAALSTLEDQHKSRRDVPGVHSALSSTKAQLTVGDGKLS